MRIVFIPCHGDAIKRKRLWTKPRPFLSGLNRAMKRGESRGFYSKTLKF